MPDRRGGSVKQRKGHEVVVIARAVRSQQNDIRNGVGKWMAPVATGSAEEQLVDNVQPGKVMVRRGHYEGSHVGVAPGTGGIGVWVGGSWAT
jgi:uncharacterized protein YijF (DUF1287 family)